MQEPWFTSLLRPELASLASYLPHPAPEGTVRLDANEAPALVTEDLRRAVTEALASVAFERYPDPRATRLRELVAERAHAHPDQIVLGCGSDEVISFLLNALARPREGRSHATVLYPDPSFVMFRLSSLAHGLRPMTVPLDAAWDLDTEATISAVQRERPNLLFLPSPNNPTGNLFSLDRIETVARAATDTLVVLDEAYGPFSGVTYTHLREELPHVGQLQTLSKVGLAAFRVGWAVLPAALAREVDKVRSPYNLNTVSQRAAELALGPLRPLLARVEETVRHERDALARTLAAMDGVQVAPSAANFLWVQVPTDGGAVFEGLRTRGVLVRSFHAAGGRLARCLRVTVGTAQENARFVEALRAAL